MIAGVNEAALERFVAACKEDTRVVAAFLGGSHAAGTADEYSDLDLCLIVDDQNYDTFFAELRAFLGRLGEAVFFEDFSVGLVGYKNLEQAADARDLESLRERLCPLEREAMLEAAGRLVGFYLRTAPPLAAEHGIAYPADLEAVVMGKLERWCGLHVDIRTTEC